MQTLEVIGLVTVHPHSAQPFSPSPNGTAALVAEIEGTHPTDLRAHVRELARLPSHAAVAFEVANDRALGHFDEKRMPAIAEFIAADPLIGLREAKGAVLASRATLVVVPASILHQWSSEVERWAPHLAVVVYAPTAAAATDAACGFASFASAASTGMWKLRPHWREDGGGWWLCPHAMRAGSNVIASSSAGSGRGSAWGQRKSPVSGTVSQGAGTWCDVSSCARCLARLWPDGDAQVTCWQSGPLAHGDRDGDPCCAAQGADVASLRYLAALAGADIVLASYETMEWEAARASEDRRPGLLQAVWWHRVVLDEIQLLEGKVVAQKRGLTSMRPALYHFFPCAACSLTLRGQHVNSERYVTAPRRGRLCRLLTVGVSLERHLQHPKTSSPSFDFCAISRLLRMRGRDSFYSQP